MFETLSDGLKNVFKRLSGKGVLSHKDVDQALNDIRHILINADAGVAPVDRFIDSIARKTRGANIANAINPGDQILSVVHDGLIKLLGGNEPPPPLKIDSPPAVVMMVGLQGCGKTTSTIKLAAHLKQTRNKNILVASLDPYRPAACEQLRILADSAQIHSLPEIKGQLPPDIATRALSTARLSGADVVILDTAGRTTIDQPMMREIADIYRIAKPSETLLVADAMTGQDAVSTASTFADRLNLTGIILTRLDGDARGGAALSVRDVTGVPVRFVGVGENIADLDTFDPKSMAARILGRPDIASLAEKVAKAQNQQDSQRIAKRLKSGIFTLDDMMQQFITVEKMGGLDRILAMLGGKTASMRRHMHSTGLDPQTLRAYKAITCSMTRAERVRPKLLNASRKRRVAAGSGTHVAQINKMLKMHRTIADTIRKGGPAALNNFAGGMMPPPSQGNRR